VLLLQVFTCYYDLRIIDYKPEHYFLNIKLRAYFNITYTLLRTYTTNRYSQAYCYETYRPLDL
jgi:hypothetical protein